MGSNLTGDDAKIWNLHKQGFCLTRISALVGMHDGYARSVICGVWRDDKIAAAQAKKS